MFIVSGVGSPGAVGAASGGKIYAFNTLTSTPQIVAPASPQRSSISFYNPGTVNVYIAPVYVQALNTIGTLTNQALTPSATALGGCFIVYGGGGSLVLSGECQGAWQAFTPPNTTNPLTVSDNNV